MVLLSFIVPPWCSLAIDNWKAAQSTSYSHGVENEDDNLYSLAARREKFGRSKSRLWIACRCSIFPSPLRSLLPESLLSTGIHASQFALSKIVSIPFLDHAAIHSLSHCNRPDCLAEDSTGIFLSQIETDLRGTEELISCIGSRWAAHARADLIPEIQETHNVIASSAFEWYLGEVFPPAHVGSSQERFLPPVPTSNTTSPKLLTAATYSGQEEYCEMAYRLRRTCNDLGSMSSKPARGQEKDETETERTSPQLDLGAKNDSGTLCGTEGTFRTSTSASLLPTIIVEALNSRSICIKAPYSSHSKNTAASFQSALKSPAPHSDVSACCNMTKSNR